MNATQMPTSPNAMLPLSDFIVSTVATQPQVPAEYKLLAANVQYGALYLDLYGTHDADGYEVCALALTGTTVDLYDVVGESAFKAMQAHVERHLPSNAELRAASAMEQRIGIREWHLAV